MVKASLARTDAKALERGDSAKANALLLLGAALDGHGATQSLAGAALLPAQSRVSERGLRRARARRCAVGRRVGR
jgi:hypothetical protein